MFRQRQSSNVEKDPASLESQLPLLCSDHHPSRPWSSSETLLLYEHWYLFCDLLFSFPWISWFLDVQPFAWGHFWPSFHGLSLLFGFMDYRVSFSCVSLVNNLFFTMQIGSLVYVRIQGGGWPRLIFTVYDDLSKENIERSIYSMALVPGRVPPEMDCRCRFYSDLDSSGNKKQFSRAKVRDRMSRRQSDDPCIRPPIIYLWLFLKKFIVVYFPHSSNTPTIFWSNISVFEGKRWKLSRESVRHPIWAYLSALEWADPSQTQQDPGQLSLQVSPTLVSFPVCCYGMWNPIDFTLVFVTIGILS